MIFGCFWVWFGWYFKCYSSVLSSFVPLFPINWILWLLISSILSLFSDSFSFSILRHQPPFDNCWFYFHLMIWVLFCEFEQVVVGAMMMILLLQNAGFPAVKQDVYYSHILVSVMEIWQIIGWYFCCVLGFFLTVF